MCPTSANSTAALPAWLFKIKLHLYFHDFVPVFVSFIFIILRLILEVYLGITNIWQFDVSFIKVTTSHKYMKEEPL